MSCQNLRQALIDGQWMDTVICFLTNSGDPTMSVLAPTAIYGGILLSMFIFASSAVIPIIVSIILAGVIFVAFPANAVTVIVLAIITLLAAAGQALVWRTGT